MFCNTQGKLGNVLPVTFHAQLSSRFTLMYLLCARFVIPTKDISTRINPPTMCWLLPCFVFH
eukprot:c21956_g2_i1 orf=1-183(-)